MAQDMLLVAQDRLSMTQVMLLVAQVMLYKRREPHAGLFRHRVWSLCGTNDVYLIINPTPSASMLWKPSQRRLCIDQRGGTMNV